ncbi:hypothetical protein GCM10010451_47480 [Streptomyces virens]|uniref:2Fe-2S ferredoxin-type domain-containing protein n=2 Tax=Streptomyces TaxID=1883 RepID=A0ABP6PW84_9ACTN|nr:2Fe-2S iron-sulfur cluster-binding protein [Streptomyces calvus]MBA8978074.1 aerobic-type carbon monoxide dehydrogenase small subunit (CoxS/CutS family) [Streptomyces calvus]
MTDDQHDRHGEGTPQGGGRWDPLPQGDYDDGATAFVNLPEGGIDALLDSMESPLAAPGHGYVPPQITVTPATTAGTDPAATGSWAAPGAPVDGAQWHDPQAAGTGAAPADRFTYDPGAGGQWAYDENAAENDAAHLAPGHDVTGQWSIPVAGGDLPDESGEFTTSSLVEQWGSTPPATLPGGAPAPWATQAIGEPWGPGVPGVPQEQGQDPHGGEHGPAPEQYGAQPLQHGGPVPGEAPADAYGQPGGAGHVPGAVPEHHDAEPLPYGGPVPGVGPDLGQPSAPEAYAGQPHAQQAPGPEQPAHDGPRSTGVPQPFAAENYAEPQWQPGAEAAADGVPAGLREHPHHGGQDAPDAAHGAPAAPEAVEAADGAPEAAEGPAAPAAAPEAPGAPAVDAEAADPGPAEHPAAEPAPADPASVEPAPADPASVEPASAEPASVEQDPVEAVPAEPASAASEAAEAAEDGAAEVAGPPAGPESPDAAATADTADDANTAAEADASGEPESSDASDTSGVSDAPETADASDESSHPQTAAPESPHPVAPHDDHPLATYVLRVNGTDRPVTDAWIGESLLYVLRERLGLAGAKDGCSQGECGACNVQVDGRLVASCLVPAVTAAGSEVRTVEGLAQDGRPSDVQRALARCGAVQCGFCVPGMAMTVHDLLEGNPAPTELETRQALCGNLCRCSGYRGVVRAVQEVVAEREAHTESSDGDGVAETPRIPHQAGPGAGGVNPSAFGDPPHDPSLGQPHDPPHDPSHDQPHDQSYGQDGGQA